MADSRTGPCRVPLPDLARLSDGQRAIYDRTIAFLGAPVGPRMVLLESPDIAAKWAELLDALENTSLPRNLWELSILFVAREWTSQFEWWAHEKKGLSAGLKASDIEAMREGRRPNFDLAAEHAVYDYLTELYRDKAISDKTYDGLREIIGARQLVELTVLIGHYTSVAITLVAHRVELPPGVQPPLPSLN
jgi:4-carboxymuconolactone decarboxylase